MQYTLPVAVIILLLLMICVHAHFIRRIDSFGVNAGYYLSGDGGWAGQMQPAAVSVNGDTGLVPAPKAGQQNSYLRGDGKWIQANNAPTAAVFLHMAYVAANDTDIPTTTYPAFPFNKILENSGGGFITPTGTPTTTFILAEGCTYKCTASMGYAKTGTDFAYQWLNNKTNTAFGVPGLLYTLAPRNMLAVGYITTTAPVPISLNVNYNNSGKTIINTAGYGQYPWISIEVVSNNNTISAFTGSSSAGDGFAGYIPAPLAGQQNYVLNGSGKWDGPQYLMVTNPAGQSSVSAGTVFKWDPSTNVFAGGGVIKLLPSNTQFQLAAGYNFKLTAVLNYTAENRECTYRWYDVTNSKLIGVAGNVTCIHVPQNGTAFAYVVPVLPVTVQLNIMYVQDGSVSIAGFNTTTHCVSWAAIEVMR